MRINPPTYFIFFALMEVVLHFVFPVVRLISYPWSYLGFAFLGMGLWFNLKTDSMFKENKVNVKPHVKPKKFLSSGPFRFSRHPMYLGMFLFLLGGSFFMGSLTAFFPPLLFVVSMNVWFIPMEEKNLEKKFGEEYLEYQKKVRMWF